jgi:hypothetical protein
MEENIKLCIVCFVTHPIIFNPRRKERKIVISYYKKWNNNIENTCECRSCIACKNLVESTWLKHPATHLCSRVVFLSQKNVSQNFSTWFGEEDEIGVCFAKIEKNHFITSSSDLWMSKGAHDVFALVISFLGMD